MSLPDADRDELLAALLTRFTDELRRGETPQVAAALSAHPELAEELRALWGAVLMTEGLATSGQGSGAAREARAASVPFAPHSSGLSPNGTLPVLADYELLEEIGRGGMGVVYKARQRTLDRIVALKRVLRGEFASASDLARFRAETQAIARLDHPHIVPLYEAGEQDGQPYFTMKYVAGTTLARRLAEGPISAREAAEILLPICDAIHFAHTQGVLHRDLKPSNILLDEQGRPHVTDFGLAKRVSGSLSQAPVESWTASGAILGTPCHMAPEQACGDTDRVGPTSDVYSLGTILYQMLTGRPPFQAASPVDTLLLVLEQEPLPPRLLNPRADADLELISLKCLQKLPELRYASARALADDLRAYLRDEPISARSGQFRQVLGRWFRETHHAVVLENWGLLWMWHSLALLVISLLTNALQWSGARSPWIYMGLWTAGLGAWAAIFWALRRRSGLVTFVERQIAHIWAGSMASIAVLFLVEMLLGLPVLTLSPVLAISSGAVFLSKAGILTGTFYLQAVALFLTAPLMAVMQHVEPRCDIALFGLVSAACFFLPGLKYYRQTLRQRRGASVRAEG